MKIIDLRSDTVTQPTEKMRQAMKLADVGDDVYGEDPTVNRLQEMAADILGKEAGLFVPSGIMGNLASILAHCDRGDEIILGTLSHTFLFETGGISALGGVHPHPIPNQPDGTLNLQDIYHAIRARNPHMPVSKAITLENPHNLCGGVPLTVEYTQAVADLAHDNGMVLHLDGARIFNAAIALDVNPRELTSPVDSITFCISKGLCAPVGSVICGSAEFIRRALRIRKKLGGGMRQAGILAAAGIVALQEIVPRLQKDHERAQNLALGLKEIPGLHIFPEKPATNMVYLSLSSTISFNEKKLKKALKEHGILVGIAGPRKLRLVTHYWINDLAIEKTIRTFEKVLSPGS